MRRRSRRRDGLEEVLYCREALRRRRGLAHEAVHPGQGGHQLGGGDVDQVDAGFVPPVPDGVRVARVNGHGRVGPGGRRRRGRRRRGRGGRRRRRKQAANRVGRRRLDGCLQWERRRYGHYPRRRRRRWMWTVLEELQRALWGHAQHPVRVRGHDDLGLRRRRGEGPRRSQHWRRRRRRGRSGKTLGRA